MNYAPVALPLASLLLTLTVAAQTVTLPLDPRRTYLRTNNDSPLAPLVVDLATLPAPAGTWLFVETSGYFRYFSGGQDNYRSLIGVFSSNSTLLATNVQQRVPGAIAAGPAFTSPGTYSGNLPMDVPEDFFASRNGWANGIYVEVPPGATHLFLGVHDSLYSDNVDPNNDYAAIVTVVGALMLGGTGEHVELRSGVGVPVAPLPVDHVAPGNSTIAVELHHPVGFADGSLYLLAADIMATGGQAPQVLPRVWLGPTPVVLQLGVIPATAGWSAAWSMTVPPGLLGVSLIVQGGALSPSARNGFYETTIAHRFALQ
ncbi:MAG: hypothetical protein U1E73_11670 [Planctomycetota bacterium]